MRCADRDDGAVLLVAPLGAVAIAAYVNIANFMDGINGISGLHGVTAGGAYRWRACSATRPG